MTDAADDANTAHPTVDALVELQRIDTDADQLTHRRERLPEREHMAAASGALSEWENDRTAMRARLEELEGVIDRAEVESKDLAEHKTRLEAQLKTVIAPREAEALMHEIATIDEQTDALDTTELEALEAQSDVDDRLAVHLGQEDALRTAAAAADTALERATAEIDAELAQLATARSGARDNLGTSVLSRYDRVRASAGVAVAHLVGHRCDGCHLDLSAAEVDDVKDEAAGSDGFADCPQCGRMLVI